MSEAAAGQRGPLRALCLEEHGYVVGHVTTCDPDGQRSSQAGFAAHLVKPADPAQVHACLSGLLSGQASAA